jgi:hypothetical protein
VYCCCHLLHCQQRFVTTLLLYAPCVCFQLCTRVTAAAGTAATKAAAADMSGNFKRESIICCKWDLVLQATAAAAAAAAA